MNWIEKHWVQEILFLILLIVVNFSGQLFIGGDDFLSSIIIFSLLYTHAQLHKTFLFPLLFLKKNYGTYVIGAIVLIVIFTLISYYLSIVYICPKYSEKLRQLDMECVNIYEDFSSHFMSLLMMSPLYFIQQYYKNEKEKQENKILIQELEIEQLKEQLNPHFLFNTFNNLYGVSLEEPNRTPGLILQMSQLMRYNLESSKKPSVPLDEELDFIENYCGIEMERVSNRCTFTKTIHITNQKFEIPPMLLLPFIENAFKHSTATSEKCQINLSIHVDQGSTLHLAILNSKPSTKKSIKSTGIGLVNVQERLKRLYPNKHTLNIIDKENTFEVKLQLTL
ncbi:MAG: sensor histidine kinase [Leadbetterella sp.]